MTYNIEIISRERKEELVDQYGGRIRYEIKSEIYGCCIKLLTGVTSVKDAWEESFYSASQNIRSHGRLYVLQDKSGEKTGSTMTLNPRQGSCLISTITAG